MVFDTTATTKRLVKESEELCFDVWVLTQRQTILEMYKETLDFSNMPRQIKREIPTNDVDEWYRHLDCWSATLTFEDVPQEYITKLYKRYEGMPLESEE